MLISFGQTALPQLQVKMMFSSCELCQICLGSECQAGFLPFPRALMGSKGSAGRFGLCRSGANSAAPSDALNGFQGICDRVTDGDFVSNCGGDAQERINPNSCSLTVLSPQG